MRLTPRERGLTCLLIVGFVALTSALYVHARSALIEGAQFSGTFVFNEDSHFYMGMARQAMEGRWLFAMPFTAEPHEPVLLNLEWLVMGWISRLTGETIDGMQLVRLGGMVALIVGVVRLSALVFRTTRWRMGVSLAVLTGGGFGWMLGVPGLAGAVGGFTFLDTYAGVHPFFWMLFQPHFVVGQALLVACLIAYLRAALRDPGPARTRGFVLAAISAAALTVTRPYDGGVLALMGGLFALTRRASPDRVGGWGLWSLTIGAAPLLVYQRLLFSDHEVFGWLGRQGVLLPPEPGNLAVSLGLPAFLLPFAVAKFLGDASLGRSARGALAVRGVLCTLLAAVAFLYAYPPIAWTLQVIPAVIVPLTIFVLAPFEPRAGEVRSRSFTIAAVLLIAMHALTSASFYSSKWSAGPRGIHHVDNVLVDAYLWFDGYVEPEAVVMGAHETCNRLPRYALVRTFAGHPFATVQYKEKERLARLFYLPLVDDSFRRHLVQTAGITHVFHGPDEQAYGSWDPRTAEWLEELYREGGVSVFAVVE